MYRKLSYSTVSESTCVFQRKRNLFFFRFVFPKGLRDIPILSVVFAGGACPCWGEKVLWFHSNRSAFKLRLDHHIKEPQSCIVEEKVSQMIGSSLIHINAALLLSFVWSCTLRSNRAINGYVGK